MSELEDPASDPELAALAKRDAEVADAIRAEQRGRSGDFGGGISDSWEHRRASDAGWDAAALGFTIGGPVEVRCKDGSVFTGKVRSESDGHGWWRPMVTGDAVHFEDGKSLPFDDIVSVYALPDEDHTHDLGPVEDREEE